MGPVALSLARDRTLRALLAWGTFSTSRQDCAQFKSALTGTTVLGYRLVVVVADRLYFERQTGLVNRFVVRHQIGVFQVFPSATTRTIRTCVRVRRKSTESSRPC